jgi:hypothetical protein
MTRSQTPVIGIYTKQKNHDKKPIMKKTTYLSWTNAIKADTKPWWNRISK